MTDDLCQECGATIKQATVTIPGIFGMPMECRQALCPACAFHEYTHRFFLLRCPYKKPRLRYTKDGRIPQQYFERFNQEKARFHGIAEP